MVGVGVVVVVPPDRPADCSMQTRRIPVGQFRAPEREVGQQRMGAAVVQFHFSIASELVKRTPAPFERIADAVRFISAPPPRWISILES